MTLKTFAQLSTVIGSVAAAAAILVAVYVYNRQMNVQVFLEYTKRFDEVMTTFPEYARWARRDLDAAPPHESPELTVAVLRYLNLCAEEFYLQRRGCLARDVWRIWEDELKSTLCSPLVQREWNVLQREFFNFPEFVAFVERTQREALRAS